jgi:hypothetical protein
MIRNAIERRRRVSLNSDIASMQQIAAAAVNFAEC